MLGVFFLEAAVFDDENIYFGVENKQNFRRNFSHINEYETESCK